MRTYKIPLIIIAVLLTIAVVQFFIIRGHKCPAIIATERIDTVLIPADTFTIVSKPKSVVLTKYKTIYKTVTENRIDTIFEFVHDADDYTFAVNDTLRNGLRFVAVKDSGNCFGIVKRTATWGGQERVITKTITQTTPAKIPLFELYGTLNGQIKDSTVKNITPGVMVLFRHRIGLEYGYTIGQRAHNIGLNVKLK